MRSGIICGGSFCVDHNKQIDHWPDQETLAVIHEEHASGGGSSHNLSVDLKKLGASFPVEIVALVGDDPDGEFLREIAIRAGIDDHQILTMANVKTSYTDALTPKDSGRRTHFYHPGTNALINPDHFDFAKTQARILHMGLPGLHQTMDAPWKAEPSGWVAVLKRARLAGLKTNLELVSIDDQAIHNVGIPCLEHLDYLIINDTEIGGLAGMATVHGGITDVDACEKAVRKIMGLGPMEFVIVHFPMGAVALTREADLVKTPSLRVPQNEIIGSNGAGDAFAAGVLFGVHENWSLVDAFAAGVLFGVHENWSLVDAIRLGHACSAASLRDLTTVGAVENYKVCLGLADAWGFRDRL